MSERSIVISITDNNYQIHRSQVNDFELLGILEMIVFELKNSRSERLQAEDSSLLPETVQPKISQPEITAQEIEKPAPTSNAKVTEALSVPEVVKAEAPKAETVPPASAAATPASGELRTRIGNAIKAVRDLGGRIEDVDLSKMTPEELQTELEDLTSQYKRLKISKKSKG